MEQNSTNSSSIITSHQTFVEYPGPKDVTNRTHEQGMSYGMMAFEAFLCTQLEEEQNKNKKDDPEAYSGTNPPYGSLIGLARKLLYKWKSTGGRFLKKTSVWVTATDGERAHTVRSILQRKFSISEKQAQDLVVVTIGVEEGAKTVLQNLGADDVVVGDRHDRNEGNSRFIEQLHDVLDANRVRTGRINSEECQGPIITLMTRFHFVKNIIWEVETNDDPLKRIQTWIQDPRPTVPVRGNQKSDQVPTTESSPQPQLMSLVSQAPSSKGDEVHGLNEEKGRVEHPAASGMMMNIDLSVDTSTRRRVEEFVDIFESEEYRSYLTQLNILADTGYQNVPSEDWAKDWALHVKDDEAARKLDTCRKECLKLLYGMYDELHDGGSSIEGDLRFSTTALLLRKHFKKQWVSNILQLCLPMDRANALYHMQVVRGPTHPRGIHWISKQQSKREPLFKRAMEDDNYEGFPSMNKRYEWLLHVFELDNKKVFRELTKPVLLREWITDEATLGGLEALQEEGHVTLQNMFVDQGEAASITTTTTNTTNSDWQTI